MSDTTRESCKRMNILIAADYQASQSGNFGASIIALARRIREKKSNVIIVFPEAKEWQKWFRDEGFEVIITGSGGLGRDRQTKILKSIVQKKHINIIHIHFGMFHHAVTHHRSEFREVSIIIHDHMDFGVGTNIIKQYLYTMARSLDYSIKRINLISVMNRKNNAYVFLKNKWFIPYGLSAERYITKSMTRETCRKRMGISDNEKMCLLLGWDCKLKGLDIALEAINICRKTNPNICLGVIGIGNKKAEDFAEQFIRRETDINPDAEWIHYLDSYEDMFAVHRAIDIYISASRREAFSYGLLEAVSQNTPTVVSDVPGTLWAKKYDKSFFFHNGDIEGCAKAILQASNAGRRESNYQEIIEEYGIGKWCDRIIEVYTQIMK